MALRSKKIGFIISTVLTTLIFGSALAPSTLAAYAWNNQCEDDKYDHVCDRGNQDITCNIVEPSSNLVLYLGNHKYTSVSLTIQASDPDDGIKKVQVHMTNDNAPHKNAILGGDGFYHVTWFSLAKDSHHVQVTCSDFAHNERHDSVNINVKKGFSE